jgi:hypothetical protein
MSHGPFSLSFGKFNPIRSGCNNQEKASSGLAFSQFTGNMDSNGNGACWKTPLRSQFALVNVSAKAAAIFASRYPAQRSGLKIGQVQQRSKSRNTSKFFPLLSQRIAIQRTTFYPVSSAVVIAAAPPSTAQAS